MEIKPLLKSDSDAFLDLFLQLDSETEFMLYEEGERKSTPESVGESISSVKNNGGTTLGLFVDNSLVGFSALIRGNVNRTRHSGYIVIGILKSQTGNGYGKLLLNSIEAWSLEQGIKKLELTVLSNNINALKLYKKCGFDIEGTKRNSMLIGSKLYDEFYMGKIL